MNARHYRPLDYRLDRAERTAEGYLQGLVPVTKPGVFAYRNQDGTQRLELRHPDDVHEKQSLDSLKMCPAQVEHVAMLDASNVDQFKVGHLGENVQILADGTVCIPIRVDGKKGLEAYAGGKRELSMGYELDLEEAPAGSKYDGKPYTHRQRNIRYNHIAITDKARLGPQLRLDSSDSIELDSPIPLDQESRMKKVNIDGIEYDAAPEVINALTKARAEVLTEKGRADSAEAKVIAEKANTTKAESERDAAKALAATANDSLEKMKKELPQLAAQIANDRADIDTAARDILPEAEFVKTNGLDAAGLKMAVVKHKFPEIKLDGKDEHYVQALFDAAKNGLKKSGTDAAARNRAASAGRSDSEIVTDANDNSPAAARERMRKRNADAHITAGQVKTEAK